MHVLWILGAAASACVLGVPTLITDAHAQFFYQRSPFWQHVPQPAYGYEQQEPYGYRGPDRDLRHRPERKAIVVPPVRVESPSYYLYAPDRLATVSFRKLAQADTASKDGPDGGETELFIRNKTSLAALSLRILPEIGEAVVTHYLQHPRFIWIENGQISQKAVQALAAVSDAAAFGLNPADYYVPRVAGEDADAILAKFEIELSSAVLLYVLDANRGRIDPNRISGYHDLPRKNVDLSAALASLAETSDLRAFLVRQHRDDLPFRALTAELARLRSAGPPFQSISTSKVPRPGETSELLPEIVEAIRKSGSLDLRSRHAAALKAYKGGKRYDKNLAALVRDFEREKGADANRTAGQRSGPYETQIRKIELALERLRWLPRELGHHHVFVNQPAFDATYIAQGKPALSMRTVVGKKETQTYFFSDLIEYVEYNPNWNVPHSILVNQMIPKLLKDSRFLEREGYEVTNASGKRVSAASVDWTRVAAKQLAVTVRQRPSDANALGSLKIIFPNDHAIYMHDTPHKAMFAKTRRAFSNGCVRLENAAAMAAAVLQKDTSHIGSRITSGKTSSEKVIGELPVHVAYFTAWPEHEGKIGYFEDVYGRDDYLAKALAATDAERRARQSARSAAN